MSEVAKSETNAELIARLRSANATLSAEPVDARQSLARLRTADNKALEELHLLKHRLFVAKAERRDTTQEQLAFDHIERTVKSLADQLLERGRRRGRVGRAAERESSQASQKQRPPLVERELPASRAYRTT